MTQKVHSTANKISKVSLAAALSIALSSSFGWASHTSKDESGISTLPNETLVHTFSFLPTVDLGKLALVSTRFKELSEIDFLWKGRIPGIKTKEEYIDHVVSPIVGYELGDNNIYYNSKITFISPFDLFNISKSGRISVNGSIYGFKTSLFRNPKRELLHIVEGMEWPYDNFQITLGSDHSVKLEYSAPMTHACVDFQGVEGDFKVMNLIAPDSRKGMDSFRDTGIETGQLMMARLNCLNDNYKELRFGSYWGLNRAFDALENYLYSFHNFRNASDSVKNEAVNFFIQKYVDFRSKNSSPYGDGYYAEPYLQKLLQNIKTDLETDFVSTPYIPPLEYVVNNDALPEYIKRHYIG